jgi:hypothetical protein
VESGVGELSVYARSRLLVQPVPTNLTQGQDLLLECQVLQKNLLKIHGVYDISSILLGECDTEKKYFLLEIINTNILSKHLRQLDKFKNNSNKM